jgi:hypothetical protein
MNEPREHGGFYIGGGGGRWPPAPRVNPWAPLPLLGHRRPLGEILGCPAFGLGPPNGPSPLGIFSFTRKNARALHRGYFDKKHQHNMNCASKSIGQHTNLILKIRLT